MSTDFIAIGERIRGIREACDVTAEDMAADLDVDLETYIQWEGRVPTYPSRPSITWQIALASSSRKF